ncbi:MAG: hypothetical protein KIS87_03555 [Phycisphaeraceae bacterium]|nr:hypothetical protein [Phycisphaeraceae bacterium]
MPIRATDLRFGRSVRRGRARIGQEVGAVPPANCGAIRPSGPVLQVGVTLAGLGATEEATLPLFPEEERRRALSRAIDRLNSRHGRLTVYTASMQEARASATGGIAFASVPDLGFSDTVA